MDAETEPVKDPQASAWEERQLRISALDMAIQHFRYGGQGTKTIVQIAEEFERYLKGEGQSTADKARGLAP